MARQPRRPRPGRESWTHFFVGTPRRFAWTCVGLFVLLAVASPHMAAIALGNVLGAIVMAVDPLAGPLLAIAIAVGGIWLMCRPFRRK